APSTAKLPGETLRTVVQSEGKVSALLTVDGVQVPEKIDYYVRVFAGKPDATAQTDIGDPHYAGSFGFFQDAREMAGSHGGASGVKYGFVVDLSPALRRLSQAGALPQAELDVTLVPVSYEKREAAGQRLSIEKLELGIANVK